MATYDRIIDLLKQNNVEYVEHRHEPVRTSAEAAMVRSDISLAQGAKALIVAFKNPEKTNSFAMVVVPGDKRFDSKKVRKILGVNKLSFASEEDVFRITDGVLPGGVLPFGNLFGLRMLVEQTLMQNAKIGFNAGDRSISIVMNSEDWLNLCEPEVHDLI